MTKVGGDLSCIARTTEYEAPKPVYTGETIVCEWRVTSTDESNDRCLVENDVAHRNERDGMSCDASTSGPIWMRENR